VLPAGLRYGAHDFFEARVIELQMDPKGPAQVGVAIRNHVYALDCSDRVDVLQSFERLDRREYDDVLVGPWRVFGGVARSVALVSGVRPLAGDAPVADRRILRQADDGARLLGVFHLGHLDAHDPLIQDAGN